MDSRAFFAVAEPQQCGEDGHGTLPTTQSGPMVSSRCVGISGALVPLVACHSTLSPESGLPALVDEGRESGDVPLRWGSEEGARLIGNWCKVGKSSLVEPFHLYFTYPSSIPASRTQTKAEPATLYRVF